jgi:hypothetical protein
MHAALGTHRALIFSMLSETATRIIDTYFEATMGQANAAVAVQTVRNALPSYADSFDAAIWELFLAGSVVLYHEDRPSLASELASGAAVMNGAVKHWIKIEEY